MHALNLARSTAFKGALLVVLGAALAACPGGGAETTEDLTTSTTTNDTSGAMINPTGSTTGTSTGGDGPTTTQGPTTDPGTTSTTTMEPTSGTSTSTGTTTGEQTTGEPSTGEPSTGAPVDTWTGEPREDVLSIVPDDCVDNGVTNPILPEEAGHYAATTLTPEVYPFTVERVRYKIRGPGYKVSCSTKIAHEVQVYVSKASKPPEKPSETPGFVAIAVPAEAMEAEFRLINLTLAEPIVLNEGDRLVVAVEMAGAADLKTGLCIRSCFDTKEANVDWWSNAADEPFAWADLIVDFAFDNNFAIQAVGTQG